MNGHVQKLVHLLELARPELVCAAVSNSWMIVILSRHWGQNPTLEAMPLWLAMLLAAVVSAGLAVYAMAINDLLDVRHDRVFARHRPLPAGRLALTTAVVVATVALLAALLAAAFLDRASILLCLLAASGILFYNTTGKFLPATGVVTLGLICAVNMLIPAPLLGFTWPVWLAMTHVMGCAALVHHQSGKRPRLLGDHWWVPWAGWAFWTLALMGVMSYRNALWLHGQPNIWVGPLLAVALFAVLVRRAMIVGSRLPMRDRREYARRQGRLAVLWLIAYDAGWVFGAGLHVQGVLFAALFVGAWASIHWLASLGQITAPMPPYRLRHDTHGL
jgi:hypothetical protein